MESDLMSLRTEQWDRTIPDLSTLSSLEVVQVLHAADATVPRAVQKVLESVAAAVDLIVATFEQEGRLFYLGAGTSGRIGLLDAVECPPTFNTPPDMVQGVMAGGVHAMIQAQEGAEDQPDAGAKDLTAAGARRGDVVCGLSASGRTPYVCGGLAWAKAHGLSTIVVSANPRPSLAAHADVVIALDTGPEVIMGSTRLKAGTAEKMVVNMLSTASMVKLGKTYRNLMVDMQPTNEKLRTRALNIVAQAADVDLKTARVLLQEAEGETKVAIAMALLNVNAADARKALETAHGRLSDLSARP